jgi:hypothetical protein
MWNRGINSDAALRLTGKVSSGTTGGPRGRGGSVDRGRGRGRGSYHYSRGLSYEELGDGVDLRGGLRGGLEAPISSATSFPRNIRPFDRSQVCTEHKLMNICSLEVELSSFVRSKLWYFYLFLVTTAWCIFRLLMGQLAARLE